MTVSTPAQQQRAIANATKHLNEIKLQVAEKEANLIAASTVEIKGERVAIKYRQMNYIIRDTMASIGLQLAALIHDRDVASAMLDALIATADVEDGQ